MSGKVVRTYSLGMFRAFGIGTLNKRTCFQKADHFISFFCFQLPVICSSHLVVISQWNVVIRRLCAVSVIHGMVPVSCWRKSPCQMSRNYARWAPQAPLLPTENISSISGLRNAMQHLLSPLSTLSLSFLLFLSHSYIIYICYSYSYDSFILILQFFSFYGSRVARMQLGSWPTCHQ